MLAYSADLYGALQVVEEHCASLNTFCDYDLYLDILYVYFKFQGIAKCLVFGVND